MYVPTFQGLSPIDWLKPAAAAPACFPFASRAQSFYRARNAIYHLFRGLRALTPRLEVLVPDYNSGNEVLALQAAGALDVDLARVGDIGFRLGDVDLAMSRSSERLLRRFDFDAIRRKRIENYHMLRNALGDAVTVAHPSLPDGACPLFLPILVADKPSAARALRARGIEALEFWNHGAGDTSTASGDVQFLRSHVLGLPIHQDVSARQLSYIATQVATVHPQAA